ncbi:MAG: dihydroxyacetone kinase subunit L [Cytophagaceae bacterium]|nr:MAG: dihydroxyacetone kinase subunit L [Cytophagaceae bacterium]
MKKLINDPQFVVDDMLDGLVLADNRLILLEGESTVVRADFQTLIDSNKVALISGGGAGHEPAHGGYVGKGMLTAAVAGPVFTSPSVDAILSAIRTVTGGTVFIHKIAGAAAEAGLGLDEVKAEARSAADGLYSMGLGLSACTVPAAGKPGFVLEADEVEYGLGIHGESGVRRAVVESAQVMIRTLVERIIEQGKLSADDRLALMVNNLGGTSVQELDIAARQALAESAAYGLNIELVMVGTFLTALEMAGCSLTLMRIDDHIKTRLRAPSDTVAWHGMTVPSTKIERQSSPIMHRDADVQGPSWSAAHAEKFKGAISSISQALQQNEQLLTELDSVVGDGDIGISLARGARAIDDGYDGIAFDHPALALQQISAILRRVLGGTSGPLYAVFVLRAGLSLSTASSVESVAGWAQAVSKGCEGIQQLGGASAGDRTMLDALIPAARALAQSVEVDDILKISREVANASSVGAESTRDMLPLKGRSSYLGRRALGHVDPGAYAISIWLKAIVSSLE